MPRQAIHTPLFNPIGPYSHCVKAGNHIFVSGTPGVDLATSDVAVGAYAQTQLALSHVIACIEAAGGTERDIVMVQVHLVDVQDFADMNRAYEQFFSSPYPARTVIGISALPKPGAKLTVHATAMLTT